MPLVCINRPNRTKKRRFTANDASRVAVYAINAGISEFAVLVAIINRVDGEYIIVQKPSLSLTFCLERVADILEQVVTYIKDLDNMLKPRIFRLVKRFPYLGAIMVLLEELIQYVLHRADCMAQAAIYLRSIVDVRMGGNRGR